VTVSDRSVDVPIQHQQLFYLIRFRGEKIPTNNQVSVDMPAGKLRYLIAVLKLLIESRVY